MNTYANLYDADIDLTHIVQTGDGNDKVSSYTGSYADNYNGFSNVAINAGNGSNTILVSDGSGNLALSVFSGDGVDKLDVFLHADFGNSAGYNALGAINLGGGDDIVNISFTASGEQYLSPIIDFNIDLGSGNNNLSILARISGSFYVTAEAGNDNISVSFADNRVYDMEGTRYVNVDAGDGNNIVNLNLYDDDFFDDVVSHADVVTGSGIDTITLLYGRNSTVSSGAGVDTIRASGTSESVNAGSGNDVIHIQSGNDTVVGGLGADTFRFNNSAGPNFAGDTHDIDLNFAQGDKLVFTGSFVGSGMPLGSIAQLHAFDAANSNFTYTNLGPTNTTVGDTITFTDTSNPADLVTILL